MGKIIGVISLLLVLTSRLSAQHLNSEHSTTKIAFILGEWQGTGWMMTQNGKLLSQVTEKAECKLDCNIITVSGLGTRTDSLTNQTKVVHDAFGTITYDKATNQFYMRAYKTDNVIETAIEFIAEKTIRWKLEIPNGGGTMRFTADFSEPDKWKETGEFSRDGANWIKIMETELEKKL